tara:strand:- start:220 stop:888 length:669 start_codon:yes stop_codon:yes gene_type:complete
MATEEEAAVAIQSVKRQKEAKKAVEAKRVEVEAAKAKKLEAEQKAAQAALSGAAKGYAQRKADKKKAEEQAAATTRIQAKFRGKKERADPAAEVNVRRERNKNDPQVQSALYLEQHKLLPLFEMMGQMLVSEMPDDPKAFLVEQLEKLQSSADKTSPMNVFSEEEIDTLFAMFDLSKQGITRAQCRAALNSIGLEGVEVPTYVSSFDLAAFKALIPGINASV